MRPWSWAFRRALPPELDAWEAEGLITPEAAGILRDRYAAAHREAAADANLAVYLLGGLLVFGGMASFVAWNWASMPAPLKLAVGLGVMVGFELAGFVLLRRRERSGLAQALVFVGALGFGANLALLAQLYHFDPDVVGLLAWAAASGGVALATRSLPCGALAAALVFAWLLARGADVPGGALSAHLAWAGTVVAGRLVRSDGLVVVGLVGGALTVGVCAGVEPATFHAGFEVPIAFAAAGVGLAYRRGDVGEGVLRLSGGVVVLAAFLVGFSDVAAFLAEESRKVRLLDSLLGFGPPLLVGWLGAQRVPEERKPGLLVAAGMVTALLVVPRLGAPMVWLAAHAVLAGRVAWDLRRSLTRLERGPFWSGLLLGVAVVVARFLEIDTGLLAKAVAFVLAGVAVLFAGHEFEKRREVDR